MVNFRHLISGAFCLLVLLLLISCAAQETIHGNQIDDIDINKIQIGNTSKIELQNIFLKKVNNIFSRMPEKCDPYVYYHRVRPYIFGTKDNPNLKKGLIYDGEFNNKAQFFRGETGAQSSIIPFLDGVLGIYHSKDSLRHYLNEMRDYMPPKHRKMIEYVESKSQAKNIIDKSTHQK